MPASLVKTTTIALHTAASLNVMGQINGGGIQTAPKGSGRWVIDGTSIRGEDGTTNDYGAGPGVSAAIKSDGSAFFQKVLLQTFGSGARLVLDSTVPTIKVIDGGGITRAELGNLGANGVSSAGYKMRASDSGGTPVFDSDGLISVMKDLGSQLIITQVYNVDPTTMCSVAFTLPRQTTVLAMCYATAKNTTAASYAHMWLTPDSVAFSHNISTWDGNLAGYTNGSGFQLATLAAGSHTYYLKAGPTGSSLSVLRARLQVFQLGG